MNRQAIPPITASKLEPINETKLTIYSRSGHVIQNFPHGVKSVTLPKSVEIASIIAIDSSGKVIPFSYIPATSMGFILTDRSTGERIEAAVIKDGHSVNGKLLTLDSDNVMLMTCNQIINIREYDRVTVNIVDDFTRPQIILGGDSTPFTLSYLLSDISWDCIGTALIDNINDIMYLRLAGDISNNTESDIIANTTLVSGEVYQNRHQERYYKSQSLAPQSRVMAAAPISSKKVETFMSEDYTKYEVGKRVVHGKDIAELGTWSFPVIRLYTHNTNDSGTVRFGYRIIAPGFIPSCSVNAYSIDSNKMVDSYLGSNDIEESQKGDEIDIMLGETTLLQCKSSIVVTDVIVPDEETARRYKLPLETFLKRDTDSSDERQWHVIVEDLTVDITNHNIKPSTLLIRHFVGDRLIIDSKCMNYTKRENNHIEWYFQVPPKQDSDPRKDTFSCQIMTASYY